MQDGKSRMSGKICLITGASSGIGLATALSLAGLGASVIGVGRNPRKCDRCREKIIRATGNACVEFMLADLSVQDEIQELARRFKRKHGQLDVLVNNAGARFLSRLVSADGYEMTFALNHLGHFLLTNLLLGELAASGQGRVVNVASAAHFSCPGIDFEDLQGERSYSGKGAYAQSKLAAVLFTYELSRRLEGSGISSNAADPGNVLTGFSRNNGLVSWARHIIGSLSGGDLAGPAQGAKTSVYLAAAPELNGVTGQYFSGSKKTRSSDGSYDAFAARRLWQISLELAGLSGVENHAA